MARVATDVTQRVNGSDNNETSTAAVNRAKRSWRVGGNEGNGV